MGKIGRFSPRDGKVTEFAAPITYKALPIVVGPDGNLWFALNRGGPGGEIGRITPRGIFAVFPLTSHTPPLESLVAGPDGNLWYTAPNSGKPGGDAVIGRMSWTGAVTEFPVHTFKPESIGEQIMIAVGPDGNLWFTASAGTGWYPGEIGRITPQGAITEFRVPGNNVPASNPPLDLTAGPDGNVWFVAGDEHTLGRITPQGAITEFALPEGIAAGGITPGPDGNLWFIESAANTIDRLELHH